MEELPRGGHIQTFSKKRISFEEVEILVLLTLTNLISRYRSVMIVDNLKPVLSNLIIILFFTALTRAVDFIF